jgi:hypothetical protein
VIPARRRWWVLLILAAWEVGWAVGEVTVIISLVHGRHRSVDIFLVAWLVLWTTGGAAVALLVAWMAAGKEIIRVGGGELATRQAIGSFSRKREYDVNDVRKLRITPEIVGPLPPGMAFRWFGPSSGRISFDYGARTYRLAAGVDDAEAEAILGELRAICPPQTWSARERS